MVVSIIHFVKGCATAPALDGSSVRRISAYLVEGDLDTSPAALAANAGKVFQGSIVLGMGFTFDDVAAAKGEAESLNACAYCQRPTQFRAHLSLYRRGGVNNDPAPSSLRESISPIFRFAAIKVPNHG